VILLILPATFSVQAWKTQVGDGDWKRGILFGLFFWASRFRDLGLGGECLQITCSSYRPPSRAQARLSFFFFSFLFSPVLAHPHLLAKSHLLAADPLLGCTLFLGGAQFFLRPRFFRHFSIGESFPSVRLGVNHASQRIPQCVCTHQRLICSYFEDRGGSEMD